MTIRPTNVSEVTQALAAMLLEHPEIGNLGTVIERSAEPPDQPGPEGWIGIFKSGIEYPSRTLGMGNGFRQQRIGLAMHVMMSNLDSGEACEDSLELLLQRTLSCILSDTSLRGFVDVLDSDLQIRYPSFDKLENIWVQTADIFLTGLVNVSSEG